MINVVSNQGVLNGPRLSLVPLSGIGASHASGKIYHMSEALPLAAASTLQYEERTLKCECEESGVVAEIVVDLNDQGNDRVVMNSATGMGLKDVFVRCCIEVSYSDGS